MRANTVNSNSNWTLAKPESASCNTKTISHQEQNEHMSQAARDSRPASGRELTNPPSQAAGNTAKSMTQQQPQDQHQELGSEPQRPTTCLSVASAEFAANTNSATDANSISNNNNNNNNISNSDADSKIANKLSNHNHKTLPTTPARHRTGLSFEASASSRSFRSSLAMRPSQTLRLGAVVAAIASLLMTLECQSLLSPSSSIISSSSSSSTSSSSSPNKQFSLLTARTNKLAGASGASSSLLPPISAGSSQTIGNNQTKMLVCYYTNWSQYRPKEGKYVPEDIEPSLCTHVIVAFGWMKKHRLAPFDASDETKDGKKGLYDRVVALKEANPSLKVLLAVGGWSFGTERFKSMAASRYTRQLFTLSAIEYLRERHFDGLDIDWEFPRQDDKKNFADLMKELREAFDAEAREKHLPRLLLSVAVSAGSETIRAGYDVPAVAKQVDFINVMSYDFHGKWEPKTGHNAPLFAPSSETEWRKQLNVDYAVKLWEKMGAPKTKLVVGLATYGRSFTLANAATSGMNAPASGGGKAGEFTREAGFLAYYEVCDMLKQGAHYYWDEEQAVPYALLGDQWVGFDDELSIRNKVKWINEHEFAGAMVWALDMDDFKATCTPKRYPLIRAMREGLFGLPAKPSPEWRVLVEQARLRASQAAAAAQIATPAPAPSGAVSLVAAPAGSSPAATDALALAAALPTNLNVTQLLSTPGALAALTAANPQLAAQLLSAASSPATANSAQTQQVLAQIQAQLLAQQQLANKTLAEGTNARVICYYTSWSHKRPGAGKFGPEQLDPQLCTHLVYAFYGLKDGKLVATDEADAADNDQATYKRLVALKGLNPNLRVMLAVGGWMIGHAPFRQLTENSYRQTTFIFEVMEFLRKNNFDGLDLCWEFPRGQDDKDKFSQLVREFREAFEGEAKSSGKRRLLLSAAVPASFEAVAAGYDVPVVNKHLDFMNVMTYDFHGDWEPLVGHNAPLFALAAATPYQRKLTLEFSANEWVRQGAAKDKLVVGLPTYGRTFTLSNPNLTDVYAPALRGGKAGQYTKESGFLSFFEVCELLKSQATLVWDNEQMIPYAYKGDQWVGFDDPRSFKTKVQWLRQNGFSGIMIWSVDMDDFAGSCMGLRYPLIKSAREELKGYYVPNLSAEAAALGAPGAPGSGDATPKDKDELQCEETDGHITYHKDKKDCTMYYMCEGSRKHHMPCPQNLVFNPNENVCDWPENVEGCGTKVPTVAATAA